MQWEKGVMKIRYSYLKLKLRDLSQGARITFIRQFRELTQDEVLSKLGVKGNSNRTSKVTIPNPFV